MSRRLSRLVSVRCDDTGTPLCILTGGISVPVEGVVDDWREWLGVLDGEPQRDVWIVDTASGVYELHRLHDDTDGDDAGQWLLDRAED
jgi:hypothetical protein